MLRSKLLGVSRASLPNELHGNWRQIGREGGRSGSKEQTTALDVEWEKFSAQLSQVEDYKDLLGRPVVDSTVLCEEISRVCWLSCRQELEKLKRRLAEVNLCTMKQMASMMGRGGVVATADGSAGAFGQNCFVEFYEPLQFLDETPRELVLAVVSEKLRQLVSGTAPPSLLKALGLDEGDNFAAVTALPKGMVEKVMANGGAASREDVDDEEEAEAPPRDFAKKEAEFERQVEQLNQKLQTAEEGLAAALVKLRESEHSANVQESKLVLEKENELAAVRERLADLEMQLTETNSDLQARVAALELAEKRIVSLQRQLAASEDLMKELNRVTLDDNGEACGESGAARPSAENRLETLRTMKEELAKYKEENPRLKAMLEELQLKTRKFMKELTSRGLDKEVMSICETVGLQTFAKAKTAFQRLYDDAMKRMDRLDTLRHRQNAEPNKSFHIASRAVFEQAVQDSTLEQDVRAEEQRLARQTTPQSLSIIGAQQNRQREHHLNRQLQEELQGIGGGGSTSLVRRRSKESSSRQTSKETPSLILAGGRMGSKETTAVTTPQGSRATSKDNWWPKLGASARVMSKEAVPELPDVVMPLGFMGATSTGGIQSRSGTAPRTQPTLASPQRLRTPRLVPGAVVPSQALPEKSPDALLPAFSEEPPSQSWSCTNRSVAPQPQAQRVALSSRWSRVSPSRGTSTLVVESQGLNRVA
eukprot:TRINITY_DN27970_c0_g1_i2.p1 TRINITY_DN27970_c0_g1~~TRINITY_DN27970_c0_g1_i2.p1  ORF type:complete len:707 (+),score=157.63 TRINITY_DN27970_c0_g1_i2:66-2186(+)